MIAFVCQAHTEIFSTWYIFMYERSANNQWLGATHNFLVVPGTFLCMNVPQLIMVRYNTYHFLVVQYVNDACPAPSRLLLLVSIPCPTWAQSPSTVDLRKT